MVRLPRHRPSVCERDLVPHRASYWPVANAPALLLLPVLLEHVVHVLSPSHGAGCHHPQVLLLVLLVWQVVLVRVLWVVLMLRLWLLVELMLLLLLLLLLLLVLLMWVRLARLGRLRRAVLVIVGWLL